MEEYIELTAVAVASVVWFDALFTYLEMPAESTMHYKIVMPPRTQSGTKKYNWNYLQKNDYDDDVDQASFFEILIIESAAAVADAMSYEEKKRTTAPCVCACFYETWNKEPLKKTQTLT